MRLRPSLLHVRAVLVGLLLPSAPGAAKTQVVEPTHWTDRSTGLPDEALTAVAVDPFDDGVIWVGADGFVFRSDDGGQEFATVLSFPRGLPDDPRLVGADDTAVTVVDDSDDPLPEPALVPLDEDGVDDADDLDDDDAANDRFDDLPEGDADLFARPAGAARQDDPTLLAVPSRVDAGVRAFAFVPGSRGVVIVATPRGLYRTTDDGRSFRELRIPGGNAENDVRDVVVDPLRPSQLYVATAAGLFLSRDGGASFARAPDRLGKTPIVCLDIDVDGDHSVLHVGSARGLSRSRDGGATFTELLLRGAPSFPVIHAVAYATRGDGDDAIYAGTVDGLFAAVRGDTILEQYDGMPRVPPTSIVVDGRDPASVGVTLRDGDGGTFFSADHGLSTLPVDRLPARAVLALAREHEDPARVWAASERGLFRLEAGTGISVSRDELATLREQFKREPSLDDVGREALRHMRLDDDLADMTRRAGLAALLPVLVVGYRFDAGDTESARTQQIFVVGIGAPPTSDPTAEQSDLFDTGSLISVSPSQKLQHRFWLTLTWDLDRLVLNPDALSIGRQVPAQRQARESVLDRTRELYIAHRRLAAELARPTRGNADAQRARVHKELRLLEIEARLRALVGRDIYATANDNEEDAPRR